MGPNFFLRMARWARHPPSPQRVKLMAILVALCVMLWGIDLMGWWPDWLAVNGRARLPNP